MAAPLFLLYPIFAERPIGHLRRALEASVGYRSDFEYQLGAHHPRAPFFALSDPAVFGALSTN
jgi:hypothetical protein